LPNAYDAEELYKHLKLDKRSNKYKNPLNYKSVSAIKPKIDEIAEVFQWIKTIRHKLGKQE